MAARREWRAAGRDVVQVREGAETARRESEWQSTLWRKCGCGSRGEWGSEEWRGQHAEETRVQPERGVGLWGAARTACGSERQVRPEASQARHQDRERAAQSAQMPRTT